MRSIMLALAVLLLHSGFASAEPVLFRIGILDEIGDEYGLGYIRSDGFLIDEYVWRVDKCSVSLPCERISPRTRSGEVSVTSGLLESLTARFDPVTGDPFETTYDYVGGRLSLSLEWDSIEGTFSAPIARSYNTYGWIPSGLEGVALTVGEYIEVEADGPKVEVVSCLGPGEFSPDLARYLGVGRYTPGGWGFFILEVITGGPFSDSRRGKLYAPMVQIDAVAVPEPSQRRHDAEQST
jgi:hypothetical protein